MVCRAASLSEAAQHLYEELVRTIDARLSLENMRASAF
jgi:hypothetical protein